MRISLSQPMRTGLKIRHTLDGLIKFMEFQQTTRLSISNFKLLLKKYALNCECLYIGKFTGKNLSFFF